MRRFEKYLGTQPMAGQGVVLKVNFRSIMSVPACYKRGKGAHLLLKVHASCASSIKVQGRSFNALSRGKLRHPDKPRYCNHVTELELGQ